MASAEMSSSEILRRSRENAGESINYEPEGTEAVEPPVSLVETDESVWKRYSSHYEFPLSVLVSLGIHILAFLVVLAVMTISFYFGKPAGPQIVDGSVIIKDAVGPDPNKEAGGSPRYGDPNPKDLPSPKVDDLPKPPDPTNPNIVPGKDFDIARDQPPRGVKTGRPHDFDGIGPGLGNDIGPGTGGVRMGRTTRWKIGLRYDEPEAFVEQLNNLQVIVAARLNSGRYLVFKDLVTTGGLKYEELTEDRLISYIRGVNRLGFHTQDLTTTQNFAYGINLSERIISLWIYIPQEMEKALLDAELAYHHMSEDQIKQKKLATQFNVRREAGRYVVRVTGTEVLK